MGENAARHAVACRRCRSSLPLPPDLANPSPLPEFFSAECPACKHQDVYTRAELPRGMLAQVKIGHGANELNLLKELADNRNKAEEMRVIAETANESVRRLYLEIAESFSHSARLIEELKRSLGL